MKWINFFNGLNVVLYTAWGLALIMGDAGISKGASIYLVFLIALQSLVNIWDNKTIERREREIENLKAGK